MSCPKTDGWQRKACVNATLGRLFLSACSRFTDEFGPNFAPAKRNEAFIAVGFALCDAIDTLCAINEDRTGIYDSQLSRV